MIGKRQTHNLVEFVWVIIHTSDDVRKSQKVALCELQFRIAGITLFDDVVKQRWLILVLRVLASKDSINPTQKVHDIKLDDILSSFISPHIRHNRSSLFPIRTNEHKQTNVTRGGLTQRAAIALKAAVSNALRSSSIVAIIELRSFHVQTLRHHPRLAISHLLALLTIATPLLKHFEQVKPGLKRHDFGWILKPGQILVKPLNQAAKKPPELVEKPLPLHLGIEEERFGFLDVYHDHVHQLLVAQAVVFAVAFHLIWLLVRSLFRILENGPHVRSQEVLHEHFVGISVSPPETQHGGFTNERMVACDICGSFSDTATQRVRGQEIVVKGDGSTREGHIDAPLHDKVVGSGDRLIRIDLRH
ncbi:hypothetical protein BC936DRAFT_147444 [Jimgerdemannia flammicorona]|uniref:Uncharacterized protein n=1 Tax=Jimgerdemannia flammicorona TaxID=994334 RepID=A0A433D5C3_9FUNG|nr:hypothetical protein BC936DRAFT_147444 [Jimgerdemannia flammicorona]